MIPGLVHDVSATGSTFFIEPMGAVKANNELRELLAQEEKEIERISAPSCPPSAPPSGRPSCQDYDYAGGVWMRSLPGRKLSYRHGRAMPPRAGAQRQLPAAPGPPSAAGSEEGGAHRPVAWARSLTP